MFCGLCTLAGPMRAIARVAARALAFGLLLRLIRP
jgi:hypothetical protein